MKLKTRKKASKRKQKCDQSLAPGLHGKRFPRRLLPYCSIYENFQTNPWTHRVRLSHASFRWHWTHKSAGISTQKALQAYMNTSTWKTNIKSNNNSKIQTRKSNEINWQTKQKRVEGTKLCNLRRNTWSLLDDVHRGHSNSRNRMFSIPQ